MKFLKTLLVFSLVMSFSSVSFAQEKEEKALDFSMFENIYELTVPPINVPTVAKFELGYLQEYPAVIVEKESGTPVYSTVSTKYSPENVSFKITDSSPIIGDPNVLFDNNFDGAVEFDLDKDKEIAYIAFETDKKVDLSAFSLYLDKNVSLPYSASVVFFVDSKPKTAFSHQHLTGSKINFPVYSSDKWQINFLHSQPLRIKEIIPFNENQSVSFGGHEITFLARPDMEYLLYADAAIAPSFFFDQKPNLSIDKDDVVVESELNNGNENYYFVEPDGDKDGIPDYRDNCVNVANQDQKDVYKNDKGDACEDFDRDGVMNFEDNCPDETNQHQRDDDGDGIGDACDGEESRLTEKLPWLPWLSLLLAAGVIGVIFYQTMHSIKKD